MKKTHGIDGFSPKTQQTSSIAQHHELCNRGRCAKKNAYEKKKRLLANSLLMLSLLFASNAVADDPPSREDGELPKPADLAKPFHPFFARVGPLWVQFDTSALIYLNNSWLNSSSAWTTQNITLGLEFGYKLSEHWTVTATGGIPPRAGLYGTGSFNQTQIGRIVYAPAVAAIQYHIAEMPYVKPYIGIGVSYVMLWKSLSSAVSNFVVRGNFGFVAQTGIDIPIDEHWSLFFDYKKIIVATNAYGTIAGKALKANVILNPTVLITGVNYSFTPDLSQIVLPHLD